MAVEARWERPDGRRQLSVTAPLFVDRPAGRLRVEEWSLGGLTLIEPADVLPAIDGKEELKIALPFQGFEITFPVAATVTAVNPETRAVSYDFAVLGQREREVMSHFLDELVRGSMVAASATIQRLDVPVTPPSLEPDHHVLPARSTANRAAASGLMTAVYVSLGLFVFGYLGMLAHARLFRFEVESAALSVPSETVVALADGQVQWTGVQPGHAVRAGDVILRVYENHLEREIDLAEIATREREARLNLLRRRATLPDTSRRQNALINQSHVLARATQELEFAHQRHQLLVAHRDRFVVRAPFDGIVTDLPRANKVSVRKGEPLAIITRSDVPSVVAYLTAEEMQRIGLGDNARLYVPAVAQFLRARIARIENTCGGGREVDCLSGLRRTAARRSSNAWARVVLQIERPDLIQSQQGFEPGLPVVVQFERRWATSAAATARAQAHAVYVVLRDAVRNAVSPTPTHAASQHP